MGTERETLVIHWKNKALNMYYKEICHEDFYEIFILFFMVCAVGMMAQAADKSVNRKWDTLIIHGQYCFFATEQ